MADLKSKATAFRALHERPDLFVMPNAWDAGSARFLQAAGFKAIGTTSGGVNWSRGRRDYVYEVSADEMLDAYRGIAESVDVPVSGDLENGYGDSPETVSDTITRSVACGMVGGSIEDWTADAEQPLYDLSLAVERIRAAREAADATGIAYTLTARCEVLSTDHAAPFDEAVRRCNLFVDAGADCVFVPGLAGREDVGRFVREVPAAVNIVTLDADRTLSAVEYAELGVRRISTGGSLARACFGYLRRLAGEIREDGRFDYLSDAISDPDINAFFGTQ